MGGKEYGRSVYESSSTSDDWVEISSSVSKEKLSNNTLHPSMNPKGKALRSNSKHPIVIVLDVTGSNINFVRVVYDKMPMFFGQIDQRGYFEDFDIAICAVGDATCDDYPLQVPNFSRGIELDSWMEKLVLEGGGGNGYTESYELAAYYLSQKLEFDKDAEPVVFFIGDEHPYPLVKRSEAERFGIKCEKETNGFSDLRARVNDNVYMFLNPYKGHEFKSEITEKWKALLAPQNTIRIPEEKAIVDLMLGVIALHGKRSLNNYALDMSDRGQEAERIEAVTQALSNLEETLIPSNNVHLNIPISTNTRKSTEKSSRL